MKKIIATLFLALFLFACSEDKTIKQYTVGEVKQDSVMLNRLEKELSPREYSLYVAGALNYADNTDSLNKKQVGEVIEEARRQEAGQ